MAILNHINGDLLGKRVTIGVTDDRYSYDPSINNFAQMMDLPFYGLASDKGCSFIDARPKQGESVEEQGERFNQELQSWVKNNPKGVVIVTQGVGPDRHTCGMMPYPENPGKFADLFENPGVLAVGYNAGDKNEYPKRITVTMPFLRRYVVASVVFMAGASKKSALADILAPEGELAAVPARILRDLSHVGIFTDISED